MHFTGYRGRLGYLLVRQLSETYLRYFQVPDDISGTSGYYRYLRYLRILAVPEGISFASGYFW